MPERHQSGYTTLLAVLIITGVSLAVALSLLLSGTDSSRTASVAQLSVQARKMADTCAEEALQVLHDNTSYNGSDTVTISPGGCTYTVSHPTGSTALILSTGTVQDVVRKVQVYVTITASNISATSWKEVGDL